MATTTNNGWTIPGSTDLVKNGYAAIDTLGNAIDTSIGTGLLAWQSYTPTLSGGWSAGNGTFDARYVKLGKTVIVSFVFTLGSTTTKGTNFTFSLPVNARATLQSFTPAYLYRGVGQYGSVSVASTTTANIVVMNTSATYLNGDLISSTIPGTWVTNDFIKTQFIYEAA